MMSDISPDYYPVTDRIDWTPLHNALCGGWMFMQADTQGRFYYKHSITRAYLIVDRDGNVLEDQRTGEEATY